MSKVSGADKAYADEIREYLVLQKVEVKQAEALIAGHETEIGFHRENIRLLKKQLRSQRQRARCVRRDHDKWRKEVGLPSLLPSGKERRKHK